jgi:hypothetical protein
MREDIPTLSVLLLTKCILMLGENGTFHFRIYGNKIKMMRILTNHTCNLVNYNYSFLFKYTI